MTLSSCGAIEKRLTDAAKKQGQTQAGINLPDQPDDCRKKEPHADIREGDEARSVLARERAALNRQNERTARCADFYDDVKRRFR